MIIDKTGVYNLSDADYYGDPCVTPSLNSSTAKIIISQSPKHAWHQHPKLNPVHTVVHNDVFDLGSVAHEHVLRGADKIVVLPFKDWRSDEAKSLRNMARNAGKNPVLAHKYADVQAMGLALAEAFKAAEYPFQNGTPEQTLIWQEESSKGPVWCRAKLDWLPHLPHHKHPGDPIQVFPDYKTTGGSADPIDWSRTAYQTGCDIQAAFYLRGIKAVLGIEDAIFRFVVQENYAPYCSSLIELSGAALDMAQRKVSEAVETWASCLTTDDWPSYTKNVAVIDPPGWAEKQWIDHEDAISLAGGLE